MLSMQLAGSSALGDFSLNDVLNIFTNAASSATAGGAAAADAAQQFVTGGSSTQPPAPQGSSFWDTAGSFLGSLIKGVFSPSSSAAAPSTPSPVAPTYPPGSVTAYDASQSRWRVAVPGGAGLGVADGLGRCMYGSCAGGLGASFHEVAPSATQPTGAQVVDLATFLKDIGQGPWYTKPWVWAAVGGVAVAGGTYLVLRKRKRS